MIGEEPGTADGGCARAMQRGSRKETSRCEGSACEPGRAGAGTGNGGGEALELGPGHRRQGRAQPGVEVGSPDQAGADAGGVGQCPGPGRAPARGLDLGVGGH